MKLTLRIALLLCPALSVAACEGGPASEWAGSVTDSAGVTIVRSPVAPLWTAREGWWVDEVVRIEGDEAVPETLFGYVVDAALGPDGRIYVLDQQARAIRVFGPDGAYQGTLAGPGAGPGELGTVPTSMDFVGDTLVVTDWTQGRMNRYLADGTVLPTSPLPEPLRTRSWLRTAEGALWVRALAYADEGDGRGWRAQDRLYHWDGDVREAYAFPYTRSDVGGRGDPRLPLVVNAPMWAVLPGGRIAWSDLESSEIRVVEPGDGEARLTSIIRSEAWRTRAPSASDVEALRMLVGERLEMLGGDRGTVDQVPVVEPAVLPVLTDLAAGPDGTLWVQRAGDLRAAHPMATNTPDPPRGWGGATWDVLDREGRYLGSVELPPRFRLTALGEDVVLGVQADPRNVDAVVLLTLHRGPASDDGSPS
ncbi:MAG TPA: hypothetical protein VK858_05375 [Longimicrobiales bacterium]|nr:hypothetical protein [Longimicrobiales bacterium]